MAKIVYRLSDRKIPVSENSWHVIYSYVVYLYVIPRVVLSAQIKLNKRYDLEFTSDKFIYY